MLLAEAGLGPLLKILTVEEDEADYIAQKALVVLLRRAIESVRRPRIFPLGAAVLPQELHLSTIPIQI